VWHAPRFCKVEAWWGHPKLFAKIHAQFWKGFTVVKYTVCCLSMLCNFSFMIQESCLYLPHGEQMEHGVKHVG